MSADEPFDECGCGPSEREKRALWPSVDRRSMLRLGLFASAVALVGVGGPLLPSAFAADYPSWPDVEAAKANEAAKAGEIQRIEQLIAGLQTDLANKQAAAKQASDEFFVAQQAFFDQAYKAEQLQAGADGQAAAAADAATKAGRVASQLYRSGGDDTALELFFAGSAAGTDDLLKRLGTMDKLMERNRDVYADAVTARDSAQSLSDQAVVARTERDRLQKIAEQKMVEAQNAAVAAQAALDLQQTKQGELQAQLAALKDTTSKTVAAYEEGERIRQEEERKRREEEERRRQELAQAQAQAPAGAGGGGGGGGGGGVVSSGWARPSSGWVTSGYGPRSVWCGSGYCSSGNHMGVDLSSGCWSGIYAASAGTVVYAAENGGYGNYVKIDHGGGVGTGYAHIQWGGIVVGWGQWVEAGQLIAYEGETGNAFGCHLHFETYVDGYPVNPSYFMADRGVGL